MSKITVRLMIVLLLVALVVTACGAGTPAATSAPASTNTSVSTNTPAATNTLAPTSTNTPLPTNTSTPTQTPDVAATQQYNDMFTFVQKVFGEGRIPFTDGTFVALADYKKEMAQINYYDYEETGQTVTNFIVTAHFKWSNAYQNAELSGCGFVFGLQDGDHYFVYLDRQFVRMIGSFVIGWGPSVSSIKGNQRVTYGNPAEADFALVVNDVEAHIYLDGEFKTTYSIKSREGGLAYAMKSGTNKDYGTRCEMTNVGLWKMSP